ncbi:hypothetical protein ETAA8_38750 [Anatilimnocola aggregata]|uniref:Uncharacterized protein n=1 Tax=Anatilimnocola aggregata TaxID=2528021 RepID=A0A517YEW5_9BACT|nr:hypothetical protein [Anatilimnocola aggregata]QDU28770.1 hypothetical protein ETAA8_38750 [Anatilimnocola aggregata]
MSESTSLPLNSITFDRLVDGELSREEYRQLLQALDQHPAAWRQCAEAFLEAQAWRSDFESIRTPPAASVSQPVVAPEKKSLLQKDWLRMLLVAAASFLLAFVAAQAYWQSTAGTTSAPIPPQLAETGPAENSPQSVPTKTNYRPVSSVNLAVNRAGQENPELLQVPVFEPAAANDLLSNSRPALPDDLLEALTAEGHQVDRQRKLVPIELDDGRQMMLPVEGYRIVPVSRPSY